MSSSSATPALAFVAALLSAPELAAQDPYTDQVRAQLLVTAEYLVDEGYRLTHFSTDEELNDQGTFDVWVELEGGVEYQIVGACDEDCVDLDLEVFSSEAESIDSDYELDDYPNVALIPNLTRRFRIHVVMADCDIEPCSWGVGVFGR